MFISKNPAISLASAEDIPALKGLLNKAYRGEESRQGWTTEANLIAGDTRTDESDLQQVMATTGSIFLRYCNAAGSIIGCVNLQQHGSKIYLGMFSVLPALQGGGIGRQILQAAEDYARYVHCRVIYMTVIAARTELINWYKRLGYADTGQRKPFIEDGLTGKHLQPLEFMVLEKALATD